MTETNITVRPPYGSVESFARVLRAGRDGYLEARALALVEAIAADLDVDQALRLERIENVLSAAELVNRECIARLASAVLTPDAVADGGRVDGAVSDAASGPECGHAACQPGGDLYGIEHKPSEDR